MFGCTIALDITALVDFVLIASFLTAQITVILSKCHFCPTVFCFYYFLQFFNVFRRSGSAVLRGTSTIIPTEELKDPFFKDTPKTLWKEPGGKKPLKRLLQKMLQNRVWICFSFWTKQIFFSQKVKYILCIVLFSIYIIWGLPFIQIPYQN